MHIGQFLFYNMYVPKSIRTIVDKYYSISQNNENTLFNVSNNNNKQKVDEIDRRDILFNYLINENIQLSANSSYTTLNELFDLGSIGNVVDSAVRTIGSMKGVISQSQANYRNMFNYSLWEKTEPMTISIKIVLYSKTDPLIDVVIPAYMIMSHAGLDKIIGDTSNQYAVPGISFLMSMYLYKKNKLEMSQLSTETLDTTWTASKENSNSVDADGFVYTQYEKKIKNKVTVKKVLDKNNSIAEIPFNSKLFSFLIDGLVYMDKAYIKSVSATFSKHTAKSSEKFNNINFSGDYPIWAELDLSIESILPAISSMLWDALSTKGSNILMKKVSGG